MVYVIEYELCALIFLVCIGLRFFLRQRFPNRQNRLFGIIIVAAAADMALNITAAKLLELGLGTPLWIRSAVHHSHCVMQAVMPVLLAAYVITLLGYRRLGWLERVLFAGPVSACLLLALTNPLTGAFFTFDSAGAYVNGAGRYFLFAEGLCYIAATLVLLHRHRAAVPPKQKEALLWSCALVLLALLLRLAYPRYLLMGVAASASVSVVYFALHNPETLLDTTSGTFNYGALLQFLHNWLEERRSFRIVAVDVCGMRRVNSVFGMLAGNDALTQVGRFLLTIRDGGWVFRMSGTRYALIIREGQDYQVLLNKLKQRFGQTWWVNGAEIKLSADIRHFSSAQLPDGAECVAGMLGAAFADQTLEAEGVSVAEVDEQMLAGIHRRLAVEMALRRALEADVGLELYLQPIYSAKEQDFTMAEVLLRLEHPALGRVSPGEFIPIAEKNGLALQVDQWVVRNAFQFVQDCRRAGNTSLKTIDINLSAAGILQHNFSDWLVDMTRFYQVDPACVVLEITETAATIAHDVLAERMGRLLAHGFRFALDDFGAGYANLAQIMRLPFCIVKLDRSLLVSASGTESAGIVFEDTIRMFHRMQKLTVVEGVETREELARVQALDADHIQGFIYARPMPQCECTGFFAGEERVRVCRVL